MFEFDSYINSVFILCYIQENITIVNEYILY